MRATNADAKKSSAMAGSLVFIAMCTAMVRLNQLPIAKLRMMKVCRFND